ncbi:MAG: Nre family DNA repair protein [Candidatus Micrarchaeia archaeon]
MVNFKKEFLKKLEQRFQHLYWASASQEMQGASPPSVFVGRFGYPKVFVGPLIPPQSGDTTIYDAPEKWIPANKTQEEITRFRLGLVRGKTAVNVRDSSRLVELMREIALSKTSPEVEAVFERKPMGSFLSEDSLPFGPSAPLKQVRVWSTKFDEKLEKMSRDTDATASTAIIELYYKKAPASAIMRALSVGALGLEKNRKLVPTRWSITAVDSTLSAHFLETLRELPLLEECLVYEHAALSQKYVVILFPSNWQYDWVESFFPRDSSEKIMVFGDGEKYDPKKEYSSVGGCYYSARLAIAEKLRSQGRQAGAIVLREAYSDYVPLGVWSVRENVRAALRQQPKKFEELAQAVSHAFSQLKTPPQHWIQNSRILREGPRQTMQKRLAAFT